MANAFARQEQSALTEILSIARTALRAAVNAPTDDASLDAAGDVLVAIARVVETEVRHG
ncbi:hypothetical protein [Pandoraea commovens]|uniref:Uncharacterized protein n=1 Tax=Pandoraea commovens TaxID=2508289 RepID=A0ABY5QDP6_9BURK|nr:hypothetical protein [Pandoraea commovens]UVA78025.1 hypothetical protein NTU39_18325 [Pandoraea commovens]